MSMVASVAYKDGARVRSLTSLDDAATFAEMPGTLTWTALYRPSPSEVESTITALGFSPEILDDVLRSHQRPKLSRHGSTLLAVLRPARYLDDIEEVEFGEVFVIVRPGTVLTIRNAESPNLATVRTELERHPDRLMAGSEAVLYAVIEDVVDEYEPVMDGVENDIDEIENQLFGGDPAVSRRIYDLAREVIDFQRATQSLVAMLVHLERGAEKYEVPEQLRHQLHQIHDTVNRLVERANSFRSVLENALQVQSTLVSQRQNEEMRTLTETSIAQNEEIKKISGWAAILFAPTLVGTVYGMNFSRMPELNWRYGYVFALSLMVATSVSLFAIFKRRGWL